MLTFESDLSDNQLTGPIASALQNLTNLQHLYALSL
jgi:hypothetical protein